MEKKDILIFSLVLVFVAVRLFMKYRNKNSASSSPAEGKPKSTGKLQGQPDDYEPYSNFRQE